jgi:two-component system, chemotaxis family, chemotaxis protein CheY
MLNKVLVVDDSEPLHQVYKVTLRRYKCETITALSREEGLEKLTEHTGVDLILLDMNMLRSRVSGLEFIQKVKAQEAYRNIPIIVVTTRGEDYPTDALALTEGNLVKPFISREVHSLIEKLLPHAVSQPASVEDKNLTAR